ncbi:MAG: hypothetical protein K6D02_06885, partial [Lachnospiraceae bacterium]|nr:hypothetical protein [Lachnospiraceae bacterium]
GGARSFSADEIDSATEVVFDSDTMSALYPSNDTGTMCTLWRWMCGPEAGNIFTTTNSNGKGKDTSGVNSYEKWAGTEPNNYNSNSYKGYNQEYCLQYGYRTENGEWNDWGPYHAPYGRRNGTATGSGEEKNTTSYDMAPMGFIVEFSPYDIDGDGEEDEGEYMTTPTRRDVTEISAQPTIESATIDNEYFSVGHPVNISSVIGNYTMGDDGKGNDELLGTDAVSYQWELSTDGGVTWTPIADATASSYTPVSGDVGAKLRCHITATEGNEKGYVGSLYVNANSSDDAEEKVDGSDIYNVEPIDLTFIKAEPVDLEEPIDTDGIFGQLIVGETLLEEGKDYTLDGDKVIISKDYLGILDEGVYDAEITYVDSYKQPFKIYVYDKDPNKVNVTPEDLTFDKAAPADVTEPVDDSKEVENLTVGDKTLVKDTDYTVNGDKLTINKDSLSNYEVGTYPSVITYTNGLTQEFNVNVIDSTSSANPGESASADPSASSSADSSASPSASADSGEEVVTPVDLVYEKTNPKNLVEPVYTTKTVDTFTLGGGQLVSGEYSVNGSNLIISSTYLNNLTNGDYDAVITYTDGTTQQFKVTVVAYNEATVVKNPPLFKMYKDVILKKKFKVDLKGITKYAIVKYKSSKPKVASVNKNGVITGKRRGKCVVTCNIIQNGAYYSVRVTVTVKKKHGNVTTNYNLNKKALVKTQGKLPEYNVYKRVIKKKKTKIIFQRVAANANVKFYVKNKKEKKILQVGKAKKNKKKKMVSCVIRGKKKGWVHLTARIKQHGMVYYTRLLVRVDDNTWTKKQLKKYLR